jgi:hypothetical protein
VTSKSFQVANQAGIAAQGFPMYLQLELTSHVLCKFLVNTANSERLVLIMKVEISRAPLQPAMLPFLLEMPWYMHLQSV